MKRLMKRMLMPYGASLACVLLLSTALYAQRNIDESLPMPSSPLLSVPLPLPSVDLMLVISRLEQCIASIQGVQRSVDEGRIENRTFFEAVASQWKNVLKYAAPIVGALLAGRQLQ